MTGRSLLVALVGLGLALAAAASSAPVDLQASVDPRTVAIGTPFRYTLRIAAARGTELVVPELTGVIGPFQVVDFGSMPPREEGGRVVREHWWTLVTYDSGDLVVPGPTVQYRIPGSDLQSAVAPDTLMIVGSLLGAPGATPGPDLRDIKPPVAVPRDYTTLLWIAAGAVALLGLIALLVRWLTRPRAAAAVAPRPPHELALEALARLHASRLVDEGRLEEFYVRLSAIVREYVEARFRLRAPEMTSEEFLQAAQRNPQLGGAQRASLGQFLGEADLVKFARHTPTAADAERAYAAARELVQSTTPETPRAAA